MDLETLFRRLRPGDDLQKVRYFTAKANGLDGLPQRAYLDAVATTPVVDVIFG